jgi:hypothetical protein
MGLRAQPCQRREVDTRLREIFEYRDLGIKSGTKGDYVPTLSAQRQERRRMRCRNGMCTTARFQFVLVMKGWATFEYEGQGERTIRKGDAFCRRRHQAS